VAQVLWKLPVPSTALSNHIEFQQRLGRVCALVCEYEGDTYQVVTLNLVFDGVEAFKCTYHASCTAEMIRTAYDQVVDGGSSDWLSAIRDQLLTVDGLYKDQKVEELKHLMIYFDDGPCYEFICRTFRVEETSRSARNEVLQGLIHRKIKLKPHHRPTGKTRHTEAVITADNDVIPGPELPAPHALAITQLPGDFGHYLLYLDENGQEITDTYHESLQDALEQARWEFNVEPDDWEMG